MLGRAKRRPVSGSAQRRYEVEAQPQSRSIEGCFAAVRLGGDSEAQPDIVVLAPRSYCVPAPPPAAADIFAIVEIADASLFTDTGPKLRLYARHLIAASGAATRSRWRRCPEIPLTADVFLGAS